MESLTTAVSPEIHRLRLATFKLAGQFNPPTFEDTRADLFGFLVVSGTGRAILIDSGIGDGVPVIDERFEPERFSLIEALGELDLEPADVELLVNSHLHFDHCGNNQLFGQAEIFVQAEELAIARKLKTRYTVPGWFDYEGARLIPVSGDREICPGVTLIATPGHTPGHQSVLVETKSARYLLAAQAAFTAEEFERGGDPDVQAHEGFAAEYLASIARLKTLDAEFICFSHDPAVERAADF